LPASEPKRIIAQVDQGRTTLQATLALVPATEGQAPAGALITADGRRRGFSGWIELASAIEDWRHAHERAGNHSEDRSEDVT
jgi:hypothetical protein